MFAWLYLANGKVAHALAIDGPRIVAECGVSTYTWWYGTGRQSEYDKAAELPQCLNCVKVIGPKVIGRHVPRGDA
jgi:hypothetical protein